MISRIASLRISSEGIAVLGLGLALARGGALVLAVAAAAATASNPVDDAWTTSMVKTALLAAEGVEGLAIDVDTRGGVVLLQGDVTSDAERTRAGAIALEVDGVAGVRNFLAVVPESERPRVRSEDEQLALDVERAIASDPRLANSEIEIASIHAGHVLVTGRADTLANHAHALAMIGRLDGVERVGSEVQSPDAAGDLELWEMNGVARPEPPSSLARYLSDAWITLRTELHLMSGLGLSPLDVKVETDDGVVTLSGTVESALRRDAVVDAVLDVDGVIRVADELEIPTSEPARSTAQI